MKNILVIGSVWPEPCSSAAGSRMLQLIEQFQNQNFKITFATAAKRTTNAFPLNTIEVETVSIQLNHSSFDEFVKKLQPAIVMFDRFMMEEQYGWRVAMHCPKALRILDTEDFHGLRKGRAKALKRGDEFSINYLQNDTTVREVASIYRCDLSLIISEIEIEILTKDLGVNPELLYYLPFLLQPISENSINTLPCFEDRQDFITIGNFLHQPNYDAILYLKKEIWPLIRMQLPNVNLNIYGAYESQKVTQLHNEEEGFLIKGFADDANEVMSSARSCLAPLRFGAGLKGKLIDAMQNGTPCIMSSIAAEGMFGNYETTGFIEDSPIKFSKKAAELYSIKKLWLTKQKAGFEVVNQRFNSSLFNADFTLKVTSLLENLEEYRKQNFTGQLLMHHTLQSTKYMSKWIELKNND